MTDDLTISRAELWKHPAMGPLDIDFGALAGPLDFLGRERINRYFSKAFRCRLADELSGEQAKVIENAINRGDGIPGDMQRIIDHWKDAFILEMASTVGPPFIFYCDEFVDRIGEWSRSESEKYGPDKLERLGKALADGALFRRGQKKGSITPVDSRFAQHAKKECKPLLKRVRHFMAEGRELDWQDKFGKVWPFIESEVRNHPKDFLALTPSLSHLKEFMQANSDTLGHLLNLTPAKFVEEWMGFGKNRPADQVRKGLSAARQRH